MSAFALSLVNMLTLCDSGELIWEHLFEFSEDIIVHSERR